MREKTAKGDLIDGAAASDLTTSAPTSDQQTDSVTPVSSCAEPGRVCKKCEAEKKRAERERGGGW